MTTDYESLERAIIDALRADAEHEPPPAAARQRVAMRLSVSTGVLGLGTSVAGATTVATVAAAAPSSVPVGAASTAALAGATLTGLVKTFAVGVGLGASVGLGLHAATGSATRAAPPTETLGSRAAVSTPTVRSSSSGDESGARPTHEIETDSRGASTAAALADPPRKSAVARAHVNPHPELPEASPSPPEPSSGLAEQQALLDEARSALTRGEASRALDAIQRHVARFPDTVFEEERQAVVIRASLLLGRSAEARAQTERFVARFPSSLLLPSLRAALSSDDRVTGSRPSSQTSIER
jgi:hypothetical protein